MKSLSQPTLCNNVFIAEGAIVRGNVTLNDYVNVWFNAVIRGDADSITIGKNTNIQDNCVLHVDKNTPLLIGENVTIGHGAIVHGCTIGNNSLIGMGAVILNNAVIGNNCIVGAGALVTQNTIIPDNSLVIGNPAKIKRTVRENEIKDIADNAVHYVNEASLYLK